jgi:DNA-binding response OmpR family regulator
MIVDDDTDICGTMQIVLETFGYRVTVAHDGMEALRKLETEPLPCLIILDLMMPGMNGQQFRDAQLHSRAAEIPVVILSGDYKVDERAAELGLEGLAKPIPLPELLARVEQFCGTA